MQKLLLLTLLVFSVSAFTYAQEPTEKYLEKVQSLDSTLETLYGVISGEKGEERNWELFLYLFKPEAKLIPSGKNKNSDKILNHLQQKQVKNQLLTMMT